MKIRKGLHLLHLKHIPDMQINKILLINFEALISMENLRHFLLLCLGLRPYYLKIKDMLTINIIKIDGKWESLIRKKTAEAKL
ncbi:MAG: hypothetical protein ACC612_06620 [Methanomethylovorans sp.]|uniref:hypothetical protein n=1 Tax=Methanomethylovorans sp. TaxID=2758717 RepID=UPI003530888E